MHWEWLVPVIFLIVWIVSSLIQGTERERARNNRPRNLPGGERPLHRPPSDIDRFLEEVNRRRRQAAERSAPPPGRERPTVPGTGPATPPPRPRVPPRPVSVRPGAPASSTRPPSGKIPEVLPVLEAAAAAEVLAVASALKAPPARSAPPTPAPAVTDSRSATESAAPALPPLLDLLRNPENLATAVLLHEVLGPPRCRQRDVR